MNSTQIITTSQQKKTTSYKQQPSNVTQLVNKVIVLKRSERKSLDIAISYANTCPRVYLSQGRIAKEASLKCRASANRAMSVLDSLGLVQKIVVDVFQTCEYRVNKLFFDVDVRKRLSKILPSLKVFPKVRFAYNLGELLSKSLRVSTRLNVTLLISLLFISKGYCSIDGKYKEFTYNRKMESVPCYVDNHAVVKKDQKEQSLALMKRFKYHQSKFKVHCIAKNKQATTIKQDGIAISTTQTVRPKNKYTSLEILDMINDVRYRYGNEAAENKGKQLYADQLAWERGYDSAEAERIFLQNKDKPVVEMISDENVGELKYYDRVEQNKILSAVAKENPENLMAECMRIKKINDQYIARYGYPK